MSLDGGRPSSSSSSTMDTQKQRGRVSYGSLYCNVHDAHAMRVNALAYLQLSLEDGSVWSASEDGELVVWAATPRSRNLPATTILERGWLACSFDFDQKTSDFWVECGVERLVLYAQPADREEFLSLPLEIDENTLGLSGDGGSIFLHFRSKHQLALSAPKDHPGSRPVALWYRQFQRVVSRAIDPLELVPLARGRAPGGAGLSDLVSLCLLYTSPSPRD